MPAGAFLIGGEAENGDVLTRRILRLSDFAERKADLSVWKQRFSSFLPWFCISLLFLLAAMAATSSGVLAAMHNGIERIVSILS